MKVENFPPPKVEACSWIKRLICFPPIIGDGGFCQMHQNPPTPDFTWESFQMGVNKDLSDVLGNFISRVTKFSYSKFGNEVPPLEHFDEQQRILINEISVRLQTLSTNLDNVEIRKSCAELRHLWALGNEYLQSAEPWKVIKDSRAKAGSIINFSFNLIYLYSHISNHLFLARVT